MISLLMVLFCGAREGYAWGRTWMGTALELAVRQAAWTFGPFRIQPAFSLRDAGYDSNVYYGYAGEPVVDYSVTAGPEFTVYLPMKKKVVLSVYGSPQYVYYRKTKQARSWNYYLAGRANIVLNRFFITVGGGGSDARERWNTEVDIRPRRKAWNAEASILWQATKKTSFFAAFSRQNYDFENLAYESSNLRDRLNRTEDRSSFTGFYQLSYRVRSFVSLEYARFNFLRSASFRDSRSLGLFGGFELSPFGVVRGRVNLGFKAFDSLTAGKRLFSGLVGDTAVSIRLLRFLNVRGSYKRDVEFSVFYNNAFFTENIYGGGLSLYINRNIRMDYDYRLGRNRYPESAAGVPGNIKRNDEYRTQSLGLYFRVKKNIGLGAVASLWNRDSNLAWEMDERKFVGLNLTYDF
ncbi:MAG TPA: outer membrane beta-barrel protein [Acidobacteriota bacterium]|nr:outer membrane beta-barrel protein [Acidobacteriota bacterium]